MTRIYPIRNQRAVTEWRQSKDLFDFKRNGKRLTKRVRQRANDAVAFLKGIRWLTPRRMEYETVQTFTVEGERLERFILEHHHELLGHFGIRDTVVLIGSRQFNELVNHLLKQPYCIYMADFSRHGGPNRLHGLVVVVLPWMEGTVLVPKEYLPIG